MTTTTTTTSATSAASEKVEVPEELQLLVSEEEFALLDPKWAGRRDEESGEVFSARILQGIAWEIKEIAKAEYEEKLTKFNKLNANFRGIKKAAGLK